MVRIPKSNVIWINGPIIVGAGPSGLSVGALAKEQNVILERAGGIASLWQSNTYDRLKFHLPKHFEINPTFNQTVDSARFDERTGLWRLVVAEIECIGRWLVVATGENAEQVMPDLEGVDPLILRRAVVTRPLPTIWEVEGEGEESDGDDVVMMAEFVGEELPEEAEFAGEERPEVEEVVVVVAEQEVVVEETVQEEEVVIEGVDLAILRGALGARRQTIYEADGGQDSDEEEIAVEEEEKEKVVEMVGKIFESRKY